MHTSKVGCGVSAETDTIADTVTPWRPAAPSVVTTLTVHAAWLMPCKNRCLNPESISVGCAPAFLSLIRPFARSDTPASSLAWADRPPWASANPQIDKHQPSAYISAPRVRRTHLAQVAELVDALVSGTSGAIRGGSSPLLGTIRDFGLLTRGAPYAGGGEKFLVRKAHQIASIVLRQIECRIGARDEFIERADRPLAHRQARAQAHAQAGSGRGQVDAEYQGAQP